MTWERMSFERAGVIVVPGCIPAAELGDWSHWRRSSDVDRFNPVAIASDDPRLATLSLHPRLLDLAEQIFGPNLALYNRRLLAKDEHARGPVFLHQDAPYHRGFMRKASFFVALSEVMMQNGPLVFYPHTHLYGHLGDAGEIDRSLLSDLRPAAIPLLQPGDVVVMHSSLWHESKPHVSGPDRLLADIIIQPADDPSGVELLRGHWQTVVRTPANPLVRSRVSRLAELQAEVDRWADNEIRNDL